MPSLLRTSLIVVSLGAAPLVAAVSCGGDGGLSPVGAGGTAGSGGPGGSGGIQDDGGPPPDTGGDALDDGGFNGPYTDFPRDSVIDPSAPPDAPQLFGPPGDPTGGPCLFEPEAGALFPRNWLRPRFRFTPGPNQNLFEIRLHADNELFDLVVYTAETSWTMPTDMWKQLASHIQDSPIEMTIRGANYNGTTLDGVPATGSAGAFTIAPADAPGAIVYWTTTGTSLKGFRVGDEFAISALRPAEVVMKTVGGAQVTCLGCHSSTPDGKYVSFTAQSPWGNVLASIDPLSVGTEPPFLGDGARAVLQQFGNLSAQSFSQAHWSDGDRVMISPFGWYQNAELMWMDLEAQSSDEGVAYGFFARDGDTRGAGAPAWSHDGDTIVYVSTDAQASSLGNGAADLYAIPYNDRLGGAATPIPGASDPAFNEYYPVFSSDDALIAFTRVADGNTMYNQALGEVLVIPSAGGTPTRLAANDPVACTGKVSPGVTNSWPKWAPEAPVVGDKTYYWLIFSSTRGQMQNPQLYVTGVVTEGDAVTTYASIYLWNQPEDENNHTPAWDVFKVGPPEPPP